jgi:hypothetical protein
MNMAMSIQGKSLKLNAVGTKIPREGSQEN